MAICDFTISGTYVIGVELIERVVKNRAFILIVTERWYNAFIANQGL